MCNKDGKEGGQEGDERLKREKGRGIGRSNKLRGRLMKGRSRDSLGRQTIFRSHQWWNKSEFTEVSAMPSWLIGGPEGMGRKLGEKKIKGARIPIMSAERKYKRGGGAIQFLK